MWNIEQGPLQSSNFGIATASVGKQFTVNTKNSSLLVCVFQTDNVDGSSCADDLNGSWGSPVVSAISNAEGTPGKGAVYIWAKQNPTASVTPPTVTVTQTGTTANSGKFSIFEVTGLNLVSALDSVGSNVENANLNSAVSFPITTLSADCFIVAIAGYYASDAPSADSGFTLDFSAVNIDNNYTSSEYTATTPGAAGLRTIGMAQTTVKQFWVGAAAAFKLASGGGGGSEFAGRRLLGWYYA